MTDAVTTVLVCRPDPASAVTVGGAAGDDRRPLPEVADGGSAAGGRPASGGGNDHLPDHPKAVAAIAAMVGACAGGSIHRVGRRPGKSIDPLLRGRVLVIGDDADLAAVALRLLRLDLLGAVELAVAAPARSPFTELWGLPTGVRAVQLAATGMVQQVPLVRDDVGGVLVAAGELGPVHGTVYVDEHRVVGGPAHRLQVRPDQAKGLAVTVTPRTFAGLPRGRTTTLGRAVQIGTAPTTVIRDGVPYPRQMDRWTFYKHTEPLQLVRPA